MRSRVLAVGWSIMAIAMPLPGRAATVAAQPPAQVGAEPASTSATFGDWQLRCQRVGEGANPLHLCEVSQTIRLPDQRDPVAEIALGRMPADRTLRLTGLLPSNVSFPSTVSATAGDATGAVEMQWRRCLPGGCFADAIASDDLIRRWRNETVTGRLVFKNAAGREVALPLSFRGLAQALDALDKG